MCVSICKCKSCRNFFTKKVGLDCTNCPHVWDDKDVDCTFGKGVQNCPHYVSIDTQTPAYTLPPFRKPVPAPAPGSIHKLLLCPFCGGAATLENAQKLFDRRSKYFVRCSRCGVETPRTFRARKEAFAAWNRRIEDEPWPKENPHVIAHPVVHQAERFYTPEEVRAMSPEEVRQNYGAILRSITKWH